MKPNMCRAGTRKGKIKLKKRLLSILLAAVMVLTMLPLGLVDTAWAAETQDTQRKAVTERAQTYIAACNNFSAQNGQSIPYWTISDAEFEGYVQTKTRDKAAETSKLKKQVDAGDFMSALTTKTCTGSNGSHQWSKEKYTCRSHYFSGLDNRDGGYSQCQGFANYMAYVLFGEAGTSESNFTKMTQVGYGFDFQPGDVLRVIDGDKNGHSMVVYAGSGSSAKVIECNWGHSSRGYCNVRWDLTVAQKQKQFPTVETVWRPNASLAVTPSGTDSGGDTTEDVIDSGNCDANGSNVTWKLTSDGTLTISGTGKMADYEWGGAPWYAVCLQVNKIIIKNGVTSIGSYAFWWCENLTSVTIPNSVTSIGDFAFAYCIRLYSYNAMTIPNSVTQLGDGVFYHSRVAVNVASGNKNYCSEDGVLYNKQKTALLYVGGRFKGDTFKIPNSVTSIGNYAFCDGKQLTSVTIPASVTSIGDYAFEGCTSLKSITISNSVTNIGNHAFDGCYYLTSVTIPNGVTAIGERMFYNCTRLASVTIPGSVTSIGSSAFSGCDALTSVTIPSSVTSIGWDAFCCCDSLTDIYYGGYGVDWLAAVDGYNYALENATVVHFKEDLYGRGACGENVSWVMTLDGTLTISGTGEMADYSGSDNFVPWFAAKKYIQSVVIESGVTNIGNNAFDGCYNLTSVTIPGSVTSIGWGAFWDCDALTSVTIPDSVTSIWGYAFENCSALTEIRLPSALKIISCNAFWDCDALTSVTIPKSVTSIDSDAFWDCDSLTDVYYTGTAAEWAKITIEDGNEPLTNATLHCAKSAPAALVVKIGNSAASGKPMLTWNAVEGATSYRIYRSTSRGSGYSLLGTVTATSYTNTGAKAGTTYYYRVKAVNDAGLSPYSNVVSGKVKSVTPKLSAPVVKIGHSASSGKPMLTWNAVSGATSYKVYRATSQNGTYSLLGTVTATSYTNTGAKAGTTYYYKVKAVNSAGESAFSNVVSGKTTVTTLTMGHSASSGKPQLTWKAVSGAASYRVYRATAKNGAYSVINTTKALTYTNTGAALGTTYYYKVEALNASGKSMGFSAIVEGKVAPVLAVGYSSVSGKPQLTWKAVPGATEYQVYRSTRQNSGYTKINTTTSTSYVNTGAKAGTTYYYKIVAVKGTAVSDFSNIVSARPSK